MAIPPIYIPFPRELYDDIVRFSDGTTDPVELAEDQVRSWVEKSVEFGFGNWGNRVEAVARKYAPEVLAKWEEEDQQEEDRLRIHGNPLVWKEVAIPAGSEVRMSYGGKNHYAVVQRGKIIDGDNEYSPSEWASKIAEGTSRNAWRDLWFKFPLEAVWKPAQLLRDQARQALKLALKIDF